jgi:hypothetical protein
MRVIFNKTLNISFEYLEVYNEKHEYVRKKFLSTSKTTL